MKNNKNALDGNAWAKRVRINNIGGFIMKKIFIFFSILLFLFTNCGMQTTFVQTGELKKQKTDLHPIKVYTEIPADLKYDEIGYVSTKDLGFAIDCDKNKSISLCIQKAREKGGDAIIINRVIPQGFPCVSVEATIISIKELNYRTQKNITEEKNRNWNQEKIFIAVLDLDGKNINVNDVSIISDKLTVELFNTGKFQLIERENLKQILAEQSFQLSGCTKQECVVQIGQLVGVKQIIAGTIGKIGDIYVVTLRLIDVEKGIIIKSLSEEIEGSINKVITIAIPNIAYRIAYE